jgi:hypothetical protein
MTTKGRKLSTEHKKKIGLAHLGKKRKPFSEECRKKMSLARLGKKFGALSEQARKNMSIAKKGKVPPCAKYIRTPEIRLKNSGENHWNWKGGIYPKNEGIRHSPEYKEWRTAVFKRDGYKCQMRVAGVCDRSTKIQAHHIKPFSTYPEFRFIISNGVTMCRKCHARAKGAEYIYEEYFNAFRACNLIPS